MAYRPLEILKWGSLANFLLPCEPEKKGHSVGKNLLTQKRDNYTNKVLLIFEKVPHFRNSTILFTIFVQGWSQPIRSGDFFVWQESGKINQ